MVRADVERAELLESYTQLRERVAHFSWLRLLVPSLGKSPGGPFASTFGSLLKQYPVLGSLLSLVIAKPLRSGAISAVRPMIKWIGIAFTAWETYRIWQRLREQTRQPRETAATRSADTAADSSG